MPTEADTCRRYVLPKLYVAGWNDDQICEQRTFTDGRIVPTGGKVFRRSQKRTEWLPVITWIMSLTFLNDFNHQRETEAKLATSHTPERLLSALVA
jgi:hypothetical protein